MSVACPFVRPLAALLLLLPGALFAANLGIVDGSVRDYEGKPVTPAHGGLLTRDARLVDHPAGDAQGHFESEQFPFGSYRIKATLPDGRSEQQDIRVASGDVTQVELFVALEGQMVTI